VSLRRTTPREELRGRALRGVLPRPFGSHHEARSRSLFVIEGVTQPIWCLNGKVVLFVLHVSL